MVHEDKEFIRRIRKYGLKDILQRGIKQIALLAEYVFFSTLETIFFFLPEKPYRVVLYAHKRRGYTCNPKYIAEYLLHNSSAKYELIWITDYPESFKTLKNNQMKIVKNKTIKHFYYTMTAKVNITNDFFVFNRKNQLSINTWHGGGAYKKSGLSLVKTRFSLYNLIFRLSYRYTDYVISSSETFSKIAMEMFGCGMDKILPIGMPRNDLFFERHDEIKQRFYSKYEIPIEKKTILYAPTFRENNTFDEILLDQMKEIEKALKVRFGGEWQFLYRNHYFINGRTNIDGIAIDVTLYEDMQEILYSVDVLITDYSSSIWDFGLTQKPCFLFTPDLDEYMRNERNFYLDIEKWPYCLSRNIDELKNNILTFDSQKYEYALRKHWEQLGTYENGEATKKIVDVINAHCGVRNE